MPHATNTKVNKDIPYITNAGEERFITGTKDGTTIGYRDFSFAGPVALGVSTRGQGDGYFEVWSEREKLGEISVTASEDWVENTAPLVFAGVHPIYLIYHGSGSAELLDIFFHA